MIKTGQQLKVSELDFDQIKLNLIDYFKNSETGFTDWDFEGSNLNTIIDMLAYNTHYNAMLAHMAINESFIDSAQLRSSVVSAAKLLGYIPRSRSAAKIEFNSVNVPRKTNNSSVITRFSVTRGTSLTTIVDGRSYAFTVLDDLCELVLNEQSQSFQLGNNQKLIAYQGILRSQSFSANARNVYSTYEIIDENIDLNTLRVRVFDDASSETFSVYRAYSDITTVTSNSLVYFINENSKGRYELTFGNGIFGKKLDSGNIIEIDYLITDGFIANGLNGTFNFISPPEGSDSNIITEYQQGRAIAANKSSGGNDRETVEALKINAITGFTTQNRAVTADDYRNLLISRFNFRNISVWGGEDNDPPVYGKVFISAANVNSTTGTIAALADYDKMQVYDYLKSKKILSITPEIVDPEFCNIVLDVFVKYNPNISRLNPSDIRQLLTSNISQYDQDILNQFDGIFRYSQFMRMIDNSNTAILNSNIRVYLSQKITVSELTNNNDYSIKFGAKCMADDNRALVSVFSNKPWIVNGEIYYIGDEPTANKNIYNLYLYIIEKSERKRIKNIGSFNLDQGLIEIRNLPEADDGEDVIITLIANSYSNDIAGKRNLLLTIDMENLNIDVTPDVISQAGNSRAIDYTTVPKERNYD